MHENKATLTKQISHIQMRGGHEETNPALHHSAAAVGVCLRRRHRQCPGYGTLRVPIITTNLTSQRKSPKAKILKKSNLILCLRAYSEGL